ncbi:MAG: putative glutamine amidotransferase [Variibacter sp.]|nr:putative glutamine amidotransferase [Variibacter sp.]
MSEHPLVAVVGDLQTVGDQKRYTCDVIPVDTLARVIPAVPLVVPALGSRLPIDALLGRVDGLFVSGGLTNIHPSEYGREADEDMGPFDRARDATVIPLIRAALARGTPLLMTCRGCQELNVAFGGTMKSEPDDLPEEKKHGTPESARTEDERYRLRHPITMTKGGLLAQITESERAEVNSLHSQLIDTPSKKLEIEARADDGAIEAFSVPGAKGFALAVIFHPEFWAERDPFSRDILEAFGDAVRAYAAERSFAQAAE